MKQKIRILFFHFDLGNGGAEKVLVNLLNNLDKTKYDVTLLTLFNYGVNFKYLSPEVHRKSVFNRTPFRGISPLMSLLSPRFLHKLIVKENYDIEVGFREGCINRVISGCGNPETKKFGWIHIQMDDVKKLTQGYRSFREVRKTLLLLDKVATVADFASATVKEQIPELDVETVYNVVDRQSIRLLSTHPIQIKLDASKINLCSVGRLTHQKSYDRLFKSLSQVALQGITNWHLYLLGQGELKNQLVEQVSRLNLSEDITFLGYDENPYKYVAKMDLFVCSSLYEGYSTAVTESVIVGTPVLTTDCSGMSEIFGNTRAGMIVDNSTKALSEALSKLLSEPNIINEMKQAAKCRSNYFSLESSIQRFEQFIGVQ